MVQDIGRLGTATPEAPPPYFNCRFFARITIFVGNTLCTGALPATMALAQEMCYVALFINIIVASSTVRSIHFRVGAFLFRVTS